MQESVGVPGAAVPLPADPAGESDVLRAVTHVLEIVSRMTARSDLAEMMVAILDGIIAATEWQCAVMNYVRSDGIMEIVGAVGPPELTEKLLGVQIPFGALEAELQHAEHWGRLRFLPHGLVSGYTEYTWIPDIPIPTDADGWHPEDELLAPLYATSGELIGILSVDVPSTGRRPDAQQRQLLELLAGQAEIALNNARLIQRLQASEESFRLAFEATSTGMAIVNLDPDQPLRLVRANAAMSALGAQTPAGELMSLSDLLDADDPHHDSSAWNDAIRHAPGGRHRVDKQMMVHGAARWMSVSATVLPLHSTDAAHAIVQVDDITERRETELAAHQAAQRDPLTGLWNRLALTDRLTATVTRARADHTVSAVLFCDLNDFKPVNDAHGHRAGDAVLVACAERLAAQVRPSDYVCRFGGDEFVLIVDAVVPDEVDNLVARIKTAISTPIEHDGRVIIVTTSVGTGLVDAATGDPEAVLVAADTAMYRDKHSRPARRGLPALEWHRPVA